MPALAITLKDTVIPCLRYRDAPAAIEWLCRAFGFEQHAVYPNEDGTIAHAQLTFGNGMVMLGSVYNKESEWGHLIKQPDEIGGAETQSAYVIVTMPMLFTISQKRKVQESQLKLKTKTTADAVLVVTT